jgi:hypothetical protein
MKRLAILGFALAVLATPAHAQSSNKMDAPVYTFNGMVFDPPADYRATANSRAHRAAPAPAPAPASPAPKSPSGHAPVTFNGMVFD